jgi:precorrin-4/cobalt-precorrin-4 C11-methyltransferase
MLNQSPMSTISKLSPAVYLVGAGPGDPELMTVKAQRIISLADVVLYADSLVPKEIVAGVRPEAEVIRTGNKTLEEIVPLMIDRVRSNLAVVRIHSGDLSLYSAIHEQINALVEANIPFELIPGISAFQTAAAKLGVELTVPGVVQSIILTRISGKASNVPELEELSSLAAHQASLCLYLSASHVTAAQEKLLVHYPADTPIAICFCLGWAEERIWRGTLAEMAEITHREKLTRNTLYLISPALKNREVNQGVDRGAERSRLYHPEHSHIFRPRTH